MQTFISSEDNLVLTRRSAAQARQTIGDARLALQGIHTRYRAGRDSVRTKNGGAERDRTADPLLAKQVLSQLSYSPISLVNQINGGPGKT